MPKTKSTAKERRSQNQAARAPSSSVLTIVNRMLRRTEIMFNEKLKTIEEKLISGPISSTANSEATSEHVEGNPRDVSAVSMELMQLIKAVQHNGSEKPKYPGKKTHSITFIEDLTVYLRRVSTSDSEVDVIFDCLEGECRNWARIYKEKWRNFEDFRTDFLNTYWGEAEQSNLRKKIVQNKWTKGQTTMLQHFISLVGQAKILSYIIPEKQLVGDIMSHFPKNVQYAWSTNPNPSIMEATDFLRKLDSINQQDSILETSASEPKASTSQTEPTYQSSSRPRPQKQSWKNASQHPRSRPTAVAAVLNEDDSAVKGHL